MAASSLSKMTMKKAWTEVISSSWRRKAIIPSTPKVKLEKRRIIFRQEVLSSHNLEADLILALNKSLQNARILTYTRFGRVRYLQCGAISALFIEKSNIKQLVSNYSNILIRVAKIIDTEIIGMETLKH